MGRIRARLNQTQRRKEVQDAETADDSPEGGMEEDGDKGGKMHEKVVLLPKRRPREKKEQGAHLKTQNDQNCAQDFVHAEKTNAAYGKYRQRAVF